MIYYFKLALDRGKLAGRQRDINVRNINPLPLVCAPTGNGTHKLGMCCNPESNLHPFDAQDNNPTN